MVRAQGNKTMVKNKFTKFFAIFAASILLTACSESGQNTETATPADPEAAVKQIKQEAEEARAHADQLGFEWNTIQPLLDRANEAHKSGELEKAHSLYQEAKHQSMLAVEQAEYADKHWQLIIPGK